MGTDATGATAVTFTIFTPRIPVRRIVLALLPLAVMACNPETPKGPEAATCDRLANAVQRQFQLAAVTITCTAGPEPAARVSVVDSALVTTLAGAADSTAAAEAAAQALAHSVLSRAASALRLSAIAVTLDAHPPAEPARGIIHTYGRDQIDFWPAEPDDTMRSCLTPACG